MLAEEDQDKAEDQVAEEQDSVVAADTEQDNIEKDTLTEIQQRFLAKFRANTRADSEDYVKGDTRNLRSMTMRTIDLSHSGVVKAMNAAFDIKGSLCMDDCADTSFLNTSDKGHFVECSRQ